MPPPQQGVSPLSSEGASENLASSKRRDAAIFILLHCPLHCAYSTPRAGSCAYFDCTVLCIPCTVLSTALRACFYSSTVGVITRVQCLLDTRQPGACLQGFTQGCSLPRCWVCRALKVWDSALAVPWFVCWQKPAKKKTLGGRSQSRAHPCRPEIAS